MTGGADWQDRVGRTWAQMWERTDRSFGGLTEELLRRTRGLAVDCVLDIGCGAGELSCAVARGRGHVEVLGIDISAPLLEVARRRGSALPNLSFAQADAATWDDPGVTPELVISRHGVMFFDDPIAAFANLRTQSAPASQLVFSCFRAPDENEWIRSLAEIDPEILSASSAIDQPGPFAFADRDAVEALLIEAGWSEPEFAPLDYAMVVGAGEEPLDDALAYLLRIGPLARYLADLDTAGHNAAITRLRRILAMHEHDGLVAMGASAWIVTAHNPL